MIRTLIFNGVLAAGTAWILRDLSRRPRPVQLAAALAVSFLASLVLSAMLGEDGFGSMRLFAWACFLHLPVVLAGSAVVLRRTHRITAISFAVASLAVWAVAVDAFVVEPNRLEVSRVTIRTNKLKRRIRIVVLSDIQTDKVGEREREALRRAMEEKPDMILLPGDFVQTPERKKVGAELNAAMKEAGLSAPLGVYAVGGNCEAADWPTIFAGLPVEARVERYERTVGDVTVTGLDFESGRDVRLFVPARPGFHIVMAHYPDFSLGKIEADLLVAGHTHGGQVQIPGMGPIITLSAVPRKWGGGGAFDLGGGRTLVISRGIGMERGHAPRLRFFCRPEIVVIDVVPE